MVEYVALVVVILGLMIYLLNLAFNLSSNYDPLKILLICISLIMGVILINLGLGIATDQGASTAIQNTLSTAYWVWIVIVGIVLIYFVVELGIVRTWNNIRKKKEINLEDEGGFK